MEFSFKKLKYIHFSDVIDFFKILLSFFPGMVLRLYKKDIWLISERKNDAHDNGYWLFKYIRENYPEKNAYYSISFKSNDYKNKIKPLGNAIPHGTFKHHIYFWAAKKYISAHVGNGYPASFMCRLFIMHGFYFFKIAFIQHGVIYSVPEYLLREKNRFDLFIVTNQKERNLIINDLHYPSDMVKCTGICRHDNLFSTKPIKNRILVMPTWRGWLYPKYNESLNDTLKNLMESDYFKCYTALLNDKRLLDFADKQGLEIVYFPHNQMQPYLKQFKEACPNVICADANEYDVQQALIDAQFLVTDYSSIFIDFAYMKKPMTYFQFDIEEFYAKHKDTKGYFDFSTDGFGNISKTVDQVVDEIIKSYNAGFEMEEVFKKRVDEFFEYRDTDNTKRNYDEIVKM